jgi:hypothetical protein
MNISSARVVAQPGGGFLVAWNLGGYAQGISGQEYVQL